MKRVFQAVLVMAGALLLWPALVYAAPPAPQGKLVYKDDFNDGGKQSGLEINLKGDPDFSRGFHPPGVYQMQLAKPNDTRAILLPNQSYGEVTVQVEIWDNSDVLTGDVSQGLAFRAQDPAHYYAALIDSRKQQFAIRKLDGAGNWTDLLAWKPVEGIKQKAEHNTLRVDASGDTFTAYVNDAMVGTAQDSAFAKGQIGLVVSNVDAQLPHFHFDTLRIYSTEPAPVLTPATLPTSGQGDPGAPVAVLILGLGLAGLGLALRRPRGAAAREE
jgi:hypothetical protein